MTFVRRSTGALLLLVALTAAGQDIKVEFATKSLEPNRRYTDIATITVTTPGAGGATATPVANQKLSVRVVGSDALIIVAGPPKTATDVTTVTTGADGTVTVSLLTQEQASATLDIVPLDANDTPLDGLRRQFTLDQEILEFEQSLFSSTLSDWHRSLAVRGSCSFSPVMTFLQQPEELFLRGIPAR